MSDYKDAAAPTKSQLIDAAEIVYRQMPPTPQYVWPTLAARTGATVWLKHENHTPIGAFKARGAITFMDWLQRAHPDLRGIATATRGNHGQAQARAAAKAGLSAKIFVPEGNSVEKNAAMRAFGAEVIVHGADFDEARLAAGAAAEAEALFFTPPFHPAIMAGVASYAMELFEAAGELDAVYVPIGCGSGICGVISARDALGYKTDVIGVVSTAADCAKRSVEAGRLVETATARTFADGMAVRVPVQAAFDIYSKGAARMVAVSDDEVAAAIRILFTDTHNVAEGAGAAPLAALLQEQDAMRGKSVGVILCGGNIDTAVFHQVLGGTTPSP